MVTEDLLFWIAPLTAPDREGRSVMCLRHADAMVVPNGWTLDDRREDVPRLFKPPTAAPRERRSGDRRPVRTAPSDAEQLQIDGTGEIALPVAPIEIDEGAVAVDAAQVDAAQVDAAQVDAGPWKPSFDPDSDLDGVLQVASPLLARAFRGTERPRA